MVASIFMPPKATDQPKGVVGSNVYVSYCVNILPGHKVRIITMLVQYVMQYNTVKKFNKRANILQFFISIKKNGTPKGHQKRNY
jgi:hypothetical protein